MIFSNCGQVDRGHLESDAGLLGEEEFICWGGKVDNLVGQVLYVEWGRSGYSQDDGTDDVNRAAVDSSHPHVDWYEMVLVQSQSR